MSNHKLVDRIIIGAGAAGFMAAIESAKQGLDTFLFDHSKKLGAKIKISGGGRCNFTNLNAGPENYICSNPHFLKSVFARYTPWDFMDLVIAKGIAYHEKKLGQQFCNEGSWQIIKLLYDTAFDEGVCIVNPIKVDSVEYNSKEEYKFKLVTSQSGSCSTESSLPGFQGQSQNEQSNRADSAVQSGLVYCCKSLVIATGGLSIPQLGVSDFGYKLAEQFDINVLPCTPALVPFVSDQQWIQELSGTAMDAIVKCQRHDGEGEISFRENVLFTHRGLSGPAILQISSYWQSSEEITINFCPEFDLYGLLIGMRDGAITSSPYISADLKKAIKNKSHSKRMLKNLFVEMIIPDALREKFAMKIDRKQIFPTKFIDHLCEKFDIEITLAEASNALLECVSSYITEFKIVPDDTEGYAKAEVTRGGIDTKELDKNMQARKVPGLYFIGEVVDVTGWLGGYNFQWAWASGYLAGSSSN